MQSMHKPIPSFVAQSPEDCNCQWPHTCQFQVLIVIATGRGKLNMNSTGEVERGHRL